MPSQLRRHDEPGHTQFWTVSCYQRLTFFWHDNMKRVVVDGLRMLQGATCLAGAFRRLAHRVVGKIIETPGPKDLGHPATVLRTKQFNSSLCS